MKDQANMRLKPTRKRQDRAEKLTYTEVLQYWTLHVDDRQILVVVIREPERELQGVL